MNSTTHGQGQSKPPQLTLPNPALAQTLPEFKKPTELKWTDPNFSPVSNTAFSFDSISVFTDDPCRKNIELYIPSIILSRRLRLTQRQW